VAPASDLTVSMSGSSQAPWAHPGDDVTEAFSVEVAVGLTIAGAQRRLDDHGPNELTAVAVVPWWRRLLVQFADPLVVLLLVAIMISLAAWALEGAGDIPFDAIVIAVIVVANAVIGLWQEARAEAAVAALAKLAAPVARVRRGGQVVEVPAREVVPGDVLLLAEGDAVCADARLVETAILRVAEAALTGESEAVLKHTEVIDGPTVVGDRRNMVFSATAVSSGRATAVVVSTGMDTEIGRIAAMLEMAEESPTPLQREIALVGRVLGIAVVGIALVVIGAIFDVGHRVGQ